MKVSSCLLASMVLLVSGALACAKKLPPAAAAEVDINAAPPPPADAGPPPLYERLGGREGVAAVIDTFVSNIQADKRVNKLFAKTVGPKLEHFTQMLADQLCEVSGGGCQYTGKSMKDAHAGMKITDAQFDALVQDLSLALEEKQVSKENEKELLDKLATLHDDIVGAPSAAKKQP
jgi:hemoglobin